MTHEIKDLDILPQLLQKPRRIVLTSHSNPDGDAIGSTLGLYHYLAPKGHSVTVVIPTELPDFLDWMPHYDRIIVAEAQRDIAMQVIREAEIIFSLDYNGLHRVDEVGIWIADAAKAYKVMIDHHMEPHDFARAKWWDTTFSSTCELVYDFIRELGDLDALNRDALHSIYVGMLTDTGGFRHATSPRLFRVVADMLDRGVDNNLITNLVFNSYTIKRFKLLAYCIQDCLELIPELNTGIVVVNKDAHDRFNIQRGDLEGVVNFILSIKQIRCAVLITERKDQVKLSMRSKGTFSVQQICSKYFEGGGHFNASGGSSRKPLLEVVEFFKNLLATEYRAGLVD